MSRIYRWRAECILDDLELFENLPLHKIAHYEFRRLFANLPDIESTMAIDITLEELRACMRKVEEPHVMIETVQSLPDYSGERKYHLDCVGADAAALADKLSGLELRTTEELARLEQERNEARAKIERQAERIRQLEGATNHAGGLRG